MKNQTPLHISVKKNAKQIVDLLISKGANINIKDIDKSYYNIIIFH